MRMWQLHHVRRVSPVQERRWAVVDDDLPVLTNASEPLATALSQWPRCPEQLRSEGVGWPGS
jgi:hypothetical protein